VTEILALAILLFVLLVDPVCKGWRAFRLWRIERQRRKSTIKARGRK
jgi:hypothetical protein